MNLDIKGVHMDITDETREFITTKIQKLAFADEKIIDLGFTLTKEKTRSYELEAKIHFRWGENDVIKVTTFDLNEGLDSLIHKLDMKVKKEVAKMKEHQ